MLPFHARPKGEALSALTKVMRGDREGEAVKLNSKIPVRDQRNKGKKV
jgi:hypothetical protein